MKSINYVDACSPPGFPELLIMLASLKKETQL